MRMAHTQICGRLKNAMCCQYELYQYQTWCHSLWFSMVLLCVFNMDALVVYASSNHFYIWYKRVCLTCQNVLVCERKFRFCYFLQIITAFPDCRRDMRLAGEVGWGTGLKLPIVMYGLKWVLKARNEKSMIQIFWREFIMVTYYRKKNSLACLQNESEGNNQEWI